MASSAGSGADPQAAGPSAASPPASVSNASASVNTAANNIGTFKGVMLCNRPSNTSPGDNPSGKGPPPFISAVATKAPVGWTALRSQSGKPLVFKTKKKVNQANRKHKKWLAALSSTRKKMQRELEEKKQAEQRKLDKIREKASQQRSVVRAAEAPTPTPEPAKPATKRTKKKSKDPEVELREKLKKLPAWALTEAQNELKDELEEDEEVEELLEFTEALDFDKFIDDLEIQQAIKVVKERVLELESELPADETAAEDDTGGDNKPTDAAADSTDEATARAARRAAAQKRLRRRQLLLARAQQLVEESKGHDTEDKREWDAAGPKSQRAPLDSTEKKVLRDTKALRNVHSSASVRALMKRTKVVKPVNASNQPSTVNRDAAQLRQDPVVSKVVESAVAGAPETRTPKDLPFLYRDPKT